jgi:hypothetical protein
LPSIGRSGGGARTAETVGGVGCLAGTGGRQPGGAAT